MRSKSRRAVECPHTRRKKPRTLSANCKHLNNCLGFCRVPETSKPLVFHDCCSIQLWKSLTGASHGANEVFEVLCRWQLGSWEGKRQ